MHVGVNRSCTRTYFKITSYMCTCEQLTEVISKSTIPTIGVCSSHSHHDSDLPCSYLAMEAMVDAGVMMGFPRSIAAKLVQSTFQGMRI